MYFSTVIILTLVFLGVEESFSRKIPLDTDVSNNRILRRHKRDKTELRRAIQICLDVSKDTFKGYVKCRGSQRGRDIRVSCSFSCPAGGALGGSSPQSYECDPYTRSFYPSTLPTCSHESINGRCQNGGRSVYGGSSVGYYCTCPAQWKGPQCQYPSSNCKAQTLMDLGFNGRVQCRISYGGGQQTYSCSLSCRQDDVFTFPPSESYSCDYATGRFTPERLPKCESGSISSRCRNGGEWLYGGRDVGYFCRCPADWKGPQCQYPASTCSPQTLIDLGFNGRVSCRSSYGNGQQTFTCTLSCLGGNELDRPAASAYSCDYATGRFTPAHLPRCVHPETELIF